jgi:membrane protein DedA with SNARE-associated domain
MGIETITAWFLAYKYYAFFILAILEGPTVMTIGGFFLKLGYADFWPIYLTLMAGDLTADAIWYTIGYFGAKPLVKKYGRFFSITEELLSKTEVVFRKHQNKILFFSKATMGFGFALVILITAGTIKVPFKKYMTFNFLGQFLITAFFVGIGYLFGDLYIKVNEGLKTVSLISFIVIILVAIYGINHHLKKKGLESRL